jgi:DNA-binding NtrC family response regulator
MHKLLVVDDESAICDVVKIGFEARGSYRVDCASNKTVALAALRRGPIDLALLDMLMYGNASHEVEALAGALHVPVLRMTGHPDIMRKSLDQGLPVLMKPFRIGDLVEIVDELLAEAALLKRALRENVQASQRLAEQSRANVAAVGFVWGEFAERWQRICRQALAPGSDRP